MTSGRYTISKARPKVERDKAWIVRDTGTGRMVEGLGRMDETAARAEAERLNAEAWEADVPADADRPPGTSGSWGEA